MTTTRRINRLVSQKRLYDGDVTAGGTLMSQVEYLYDEAGSFAGSELPVQHDNANYSTSLVVGRANLSSVKLYNVPTSQFTTTTSKYNRAGSLISSKDALEHEVTISYTDAFAFGGHKPRSRSPVCDPRISDDDQ